MSFLCLHIQLQYFARISLGGFVGTDEMLLKPSGDFWGGLKHNKATNY